MKKPNVRKCPLGWTCIGGGYGGYGMTPQKAYEQWKREVNAIATSVASMTLLGIPR